MQYSTSLEPHHTCRWVSHTGLTFVAIHSFASFPFAFPFVLFLPIFPSYLSASLFFFFHFLLPYLAVINPSCLPLFGSFFFFLSFIPSYLTIFPSFSFPSLLVISQSFLPLPLHNSLLSHQLFFLFLSITPCYLTNFSSSSSFLLNVSWIVLHRSFLRTFLTRRLHFLSSIS